MTTLLTFFLALMHACTGRTAPPIFMHHDSIAAALSSFCGYNFKTVSDTTKASNNLY
jgi:hypothetical protein